MGHRDLKDFEAEFGSYEHCVPPGVLLPQIQIEKKYYKELNLKEDISNFDFLRELCLKGIRDKGVDKLKNKKVYYARAKEELSILKELGFVDYILLNWDILNFCHEEGIPTGPGRGSAAGSLVLFLLEVTKIDPVKYDLFFERFVSNPF